MSSSKKKRIAMSFAGISLAFAAANAFAGGDIAVTSTVAKLDDPQNPYQACPPSGSASADVSPGDVVGVCYMMTNNSDDPLLYHSLSDNLAGQIAEVAFPVYPSWEAPLVNVFVAGTQSQTRTGTWHARSAPTNFVPQALDFEEIGDRLFVDGFDGGGSAAGFVDISQNGIRLGPNEHRYVALPFPFRVSDDFDSGTLSHLCITRVGAVTADQSLCGFLSAVNGDLSTLAYMEVPDILLPILAPYWDEFSSGDIYYTTLGTAPRRRFVVQWTRMQFPGAPGQEGITFQLMLDEASGAIDFIYPKVHFGSGDASVDAGASATIGLQYTMSRGRQYSFNAPVLHDGMTIHWKPDLVASHTAVSGPVNINVGAPVVRTTPDAASGISMTVAAGSTGSTLLTLANEGNRHLTWALGEASSTAHVPLVPAHAPRTTDGRAVLTPNPASGTPRGADTGVVPVVGINGRSASNGGDYVPELVTFDASRPQDGFLVMGDVPPYWYYNYGDFLGNDFSTYWSNATAFDLVSLAATPYFEFYNITTLDVPSPLLPGLEMRAMKWDPVTKNTYYLGHQSNENGCTTLLLRVGFSPVSTSLVGTTTEACLLNLAIDRNGLAYGIGYDGILYAVDKTTMQVQPIAPIAIDLTSMYWRGTSLDFDDATGDLYMQVYNVQPSVPLFESRMYRLDVTTGQTQNLGTFPHQHTWDVDIRAIAIARPDPTPCSRPGDVPWLSYDQRSGTIAPNGQAGVSVRANAAGLSAGSYDATVCVQSNDPHRRRIALPLHLTVN